MRSLIILTSAMLVFLACRREKSECPSSPASQVDGRDKFVGQYRVNDTTGTYLYSMEIMKASGTSGIDSLFVFNWGNRFDMYVQHDKGNMTNLLNIVPPFPSFDHNGNRWAFFSQNDPVFQANMLIGDTLRMSYRISNIAFYNQDGVPYFDWSLV